MKKIFIILAILFFAAIGAVEFYVQSDAFSERIRPSIVGPLREMLGPAARIGFIKANFIPPRLEVRDISISDSRGTDALSIRKVIIYINPLPLIFKKIRLPAITILEPRIHVDRAQDGSFPVMALVDRIRSAIARTEGSASPGYSLVLRTVSVKRGEVWYTDDALSSQVSVTGLNMTSRFNLANDKISLIIRGSHVRAVAPAYPVLSGELRASAEYDRGRVRLNSSELATDDASITLNGEAGPFPDPVLNLSGKILSGPHTIGKFAEILKPKPRQPGPRVDASIAIKGKASDPDVAGTIKLAGITYQDVTLQDAALTFRYRDKNLLIGGGNWHVAKKEKTLALDRIGTSLTYQRGALSIEHFEIAAGDLVVRMRGALDPAKGIAVHLTAASTGEGKTISFAGGLPIQGELNLEGDISGPLNSPRFDGNVAAGPVSVRGVQFSSARGSLSYRAGKATVSSVDIRRQTSQYMLDGAMDVSGAEPVYTARLKVIQSEVVSIIALFYEPLPLRLSAHGELAFQGTARNYSGSGYLTLDAGSAYGETFTRGAVTASLSTGKISFPQAVVYKKQGVIKGTGWISFDGHYSADIEGRHIELSSIDYLEGVPAAGDASIDLHSSGTFGKPTATATLDTEEFYLRQVPLGRMHCDADLREGRLRIAAGLSEDMTGATFLWQLHKPYAWTAQASVKTDGFNPLLLIDNKDVSDRVKLIAEGSATLRGNGLNVSSMTGEAVFRTIGLVVGEYRVDNEAPSKFSLDNGKVTIKSLSFIAPGSRISVSGSTKALNDVDLTIKGSANLPLLKMIFPEVEHAAGTAEMLLTVKDDWSNPSIAGSLRVQNGEIKIKDVPQKFNALNGTITFAHDRIVTESLAGEIGGGTLGVSGWVQLSGFALKEFSIKTAVDNVTTRYPEGLISTVSGNLYLDGDAGERTLSGDVLIKRARYDKRIEWKSMLVDIGRGLYQKKQTDVGWIGDTLVNVRFHGNENIVFQNNLAQMPLDIDVFLRGTVNHPQVLGRIEARKGTVYFRKNDFKILHASVDFVDPNRMNPVLDIQAETQVREYQIRLAVTGSADRAVVTLISDPALIDTDILSLLALGKKGSELKGKETSVGVGEAASFATGQFQDIFERRARSLTGLDRFQVDPYVSKSDTSVPRVTVAKELVQNKLYVTYSSNVGASIPEQVFRIEYLLDKHFSLVGERNEVGNYGADFKYRFEFR